MHSLLKCQDLVWTQEGKQDVDNSAHADRHNRDVMEESVQQKDSVLETLDGFILSSNYGEFSTRVQLLRTFYEQIVIEISAGYDNGLPGNEEVAKASTRSFIRNLLYNIHHYYNQFKDQVDSSLKQLREPLEKKVRDFIQLAKWDDLNYYALRTSSEKSHRTLNKLSRHLEDLLRQPVSNILEKPDEEDPNSAEGDQQHSAPATVNFFSLHKNASFLRRGLLDLQTVSTGDRFKSLPLRMVFDLGNPTQCFSSGQSLIAF